MPQTDRIIRWAVIAGAFAGLTGVMLGAFGAHGLKGVLDARALEVYETGVTYQLYHALALLAVAILAGLGLPRRLLAISACFFAVGIVLFSGSLYGLALGHWRFLGPVTPLGGLCLMVGWVFLIVSAWRTASA